MTLNAYLIPRNPTEVLRAAPKDFHTNGQPSKPGIGIFTDRKLLQFLTEAQALTLANQLADAVTEQRNRRKTSQAESN